MQLMALIQYYNVYIITRKLSMLQIYTMCIQNGKCFHGYDMFILLNICSKNLHFSMTKFFHLYSSAKVTAVCKHDPPINHVSIEEDIETLHLNSVLANDN